MRRLVYDILIGLQKISDRIEQGDDRCSGRSMQSGEMRIGRRNSEWVEATAVLDKCAAG